MTQSPSPSRIAKTLSRTAQLLPFLLAAASVLPAAPAAAQTSCDLARSGCGQIVPTTCGGTPATGAPRSLWGELQPTDTGQLPSERDSTGFPEFAQNYDSTNWFVGLSIQNNYLVTGSSHGLATWDLHTDPAHPHFLGRLTDASFPVWAIGEIKWPLQDIAMVQGDDTIAALSGESNIGVAFVDTSNKTSPRLLYQNHLKSGEEVYAANIGGTEYAFLAASQGSPSGGVYAFNLTQARQYTSCLEGVPAPGEVTHCPGVYVGKIGTANSAFFISGVDNYIAFSSGGGGFEIWDVSNPASPHQVLHGLDGAPPPTCPFATPTVYGVAMWKNNNHYYVGLRSQVYSCTAVPPGNVSQGQIYDVSCITGGSCSLGSALWTQPLFQDGTRAYFVTFSRGAGNTSYLYYGSEDRCLGAPEREYLFDVTVPTATRDIAPQTGYWGWYYRGNATGFNYIMPRRGVFNGSYFYRAALAILDVHQHVGAVVPTADFSFSPQQIYPGDTVTFTDQSTGSPTSWNWTFSPDGTPAGSTSTSSQNPQVKFAAKGTKTVSLTATNAVGPSTPTSKQVTVLDPSPQIGTVTVSPANPLQCQPVTFTATGVTGQATLGYSWKITNSDSVVAPGGTSAANPFTWDTHLNNPIPQPYTATITVSNGVGTTTKSASFSLGALPPLPTSTFTPTNSAFSAGTVQFNVAVAGATEWNWDFGDGAGFTGWTSDPIAGPSPSHTYTTIGNKSVVVKVRNCLSDPNGLQSAPLVVDILQIAPLVARFQASCSFAPCSFSTGQAIAFADQSQGAQVWDYDWTHTGSSATSCSFTDSGHTSAVIAHTYAASGSYTPCLRVHRGASETNVYVHPQFSVSPVITLPVSLSISGPTSGTPGQALAYTAIGSNCTPAANGWSWSLPGGTPSSASTATVSVTYSATGLHHITVTNSACAGATGSASVNISNGNGGGGGALGAVFTFSPTTPTTNQPVSFDASASTGSPTLYSWAFGDGQSGSGVSTSHSYAKAGNYSVVLTVCSAATCVSSTPQAVVVGGGGPPPLDPNYTSSATCFNQFGVKECDGQAGTVITLSAVTTLATSYTWNFGDGSTGTGPSVTHTWAAAGNYNVTLLVANSQTNATLTLVFKLTAPTAVPQSVLLPWLASTRGVLTQSSDLYIHNPASTPMDVALEFRRRLGTPETNPPRASRTIAPGATLFSADVLNDLFGRPENTVGYVTVAVANGVAPIITSYNTTFQSDGTQFGQTISGVTMPTAGAASQASSEASQVQHLVALNDNSDEVSYFGLSNPNNGPATYKLSLFDNQGKAIGSPTTFTMARLGLQQFQREDIESMFGVSNAHDYRVQIDSVSGGQLYPYGAKLRTISFDPSFVQPGVNKSKLYVIGALSTPGLNNTIWRSDLVLANTSAQAIQTTVSYISAGLGNQTLAPVTLTLQPGETQRLANVVADKWGVTDAVGTLTLETDAASSAFPLVQAESYDFSQSVRRFGQSMPALSDADAAGTGQGNYMVGLRQDATHWTALWLFNPSTTDAGTYDLVYRGLDGTVLGQTSGLRLPAGKTKLIRPSEHPLPAAGVTGGFTVQILVHSGKILSAGQVVNLTTNDPAYIVGATR